MNKKLITLAVAAAMTAPAAVFAEATIYGVLHNHLDYVDVDENARTFGPGSVPGTGVPSVPVRSDNLFVTFDAQGVPASIAVVPGGPNTAYVATEDGEIIFAEDNGGRPGSASVSAGDVFSNNPADAPAFPNSLYPALQKSADYKGWDINANNPSNRIGIKGSEDLGGGLKAIYQVEMGVSLANTDDNIANGDKGTLSFRNSFVGLAGNFGTFLVGRHDTPLKISTGKLDMFADTLADYNHTVGFHDVRADNVVAYISPSFSGFQFAGAVIPAGGATPVGLGVPGESPDGIADAYSLAVIYSNGPFYAGGGFESLGDQHWAGLNSDFMDNGVTYNTYRGVPGYGEADDWNKWRIGLGILDWNGFSLGGIYEDNSNVLGAPQEADMKIWQVQAGYSFGNNTIKGMYGQNDVDSCVGTNYSTVCSSAVQSALGFYGINANVGQIPYLNNQDFDSWAVAFDHNFSKRTRAYALYTATDSDQGSSDWSGFSLGLTHKF